jgi:hypothetical protein
MVNGHKLMDEPPDSADQLSLVERVFPNPDTVSQGEYITIYELLLSPDISNDPEMIAGVLREFSGWAAYMLRRMQELGLIGGDEMVD